MINEAKILLLLSLTYLIFIIPSFAQITGKNKMEPIIISGRISDNSNAPIKSKIFLLDEKGKTINSTVTDSKGKFQFTDLPADKNFLVKIEEKDPGLNIDVFQTNNNCRIIRKTIKDKNNIIRFEELSKDNGNITLLDYTDLEIEVDEGNASVIGKIVDCNEPIIGIENLRVYLYNAQKVIDSTITDRFGKFKFKNLPAKETYLIKLTEVEVELYAELFIVNDKGKVVMSSNAKDLDMECFFHFKKLPTIEHKIVVEGD